MTCAELRCTVSRLPTKMTRGRGAVEVRAGRSFPHTEPSRRAVTQHAPAAPHSAPARMQCTGPPPLGTGRHPQRAAHRTPDCQPRPAAPPASCSGSSLISARRGSSLRAPRFFPGSPPLAPIVATPAPNHRSPARLPPRKPCTRVHRCRDRPTFPLIATAPTTCPFSITTPVPSCSRPLPFSLAGGRRFSQSPHVIGDESCGLQQRAVGKSTYYCGLRIFFWAARETEPMWWGPQ